MRWLRRDNEHRERDEAEVVGFRRCPHIVLMPRWSNADDVGDVDRVASYRCEACGTAFTLAEADALRETEVARLRRMVA
jgi:hypothetical protein